jgi:hypothetical protein
MSKGRLYLCNRWYRLIVLHRTAFDVYECLRAGYTLMNRPFVRWDRVR